MAEKKSLRTLADELEKLSDPDSGTAYAFVHDEASMEVVGDRDALVQIAVAFARTAALAEESTDRSKAGPWITAVFKPGTEFNTIWPTYDPTPTPPKNPESDLKQKIVEASVNTGCLLFVVLAAIGLVSVVRWVL